MKKMAPWFGLVVGLSISCLLAAFFHESPLHVLQVLSTSFMNSKFDFGLTLFYTTVLIFSGLSFAVPMKAGLFHIGSEGQILLSGLFAAWLGIYIHPFTNSISVFVSVLVVICGTLASGILSALIISVFKIFRQAHEVVVAIMLNFIFAAFTTWITVNHLQNPQSQNPETSPLNAPFRFLQSDFLKLYFENSPVSCFFIIALVACVILFFFERKTLLGRHISAFGHNPRAAERIGISPRKILIVSMGMAGAFSAFAGLSEVFGNTFQFKVGFSPQYGFLGIAVALLAQQNYLGIIGSAFLMACLHKGASDLDLETEFLTRDFSRILQAVIIFAVAASYFVSSKLDKIRQRDS